MRSHIITRRASSHLACLGAFQLYDIDKDGTIAYEEMLQIVQSIYKMGGGMVTLHPDEDTPKKVLLPPAIVTCC